MRKYQLFFLFIFLLFLNSCRISGPKSITGIWRGSVGSNGIEVDFYWRINQKDSGEYLAYYDCPFYGVKDTPVPLVKFEADSIHLAVELFPAEYFGKINSRSNRIAGKFYGESSCFDLDLYRISNNPEEILPYMVPRINPIGVINKEYNYLEPESGLDWEVAHVEEAGLDTELLEEFTAHVIDSKYPNLHSLLIARNNQLVYEEYFYGHQKHTPHHIYSNGKGLTALGIGIALDQGKIENLDTRIIDFFPEYEEILAKDGKDKITLNNMLSMTAGFEWDETSTSYYDQRNSNRQMMNQNDWLAYLFDQPLSRNPGEKYTYNSGIPHALNRILWQKTGEYPWDYVATHVMKPLDFKNYHWDIQPGPMWHGTFLRPRDFLKLAQLYKDKGAWEGKQIISASWFDNCYLESEDFQNPEYWNHWGKSVISVDGIPVEMFSGGGFGGQSIKAIPAFDLVVAFTGGNYFTESFEQEEIVTKYVLPPLIKSNPDYLKSLNIDNKASVVLPGLEWKETIFTDLGCIHGALEYYNMPVSESWIYGVTGTAFALNANPSLNSSSLGRWSNYRKIELLKQAGIELTNYSAHISQPNFEEIRSLAWNEVKKALNNNQPAYGFHMNIPVSYLIYGYNQKGYFYKGVDCKSGYGPKRWDRVAQNDPGWFELHTVKKIRSTTTELELYKNVIAYAVEMFETPDNFPHYGFTFGLNAYDHWINALNSGSADTFGVAYNALGWSTARRNAVEFLKLSKDKFPGESEIYLDEAISAYSQVAAHWEAVSDLFPYTNTERWQRNDNWNNVNNRQKAISLLQQAKTHEEEGIEALIKFNQAIN